MKKIPYIIAAAFLAGTVSCTEFDEPRTPIREAGTPVTVAVSLNVAGELAPDGTAAEQTRVAQDVTVDEGSFKDLWVFQFAGTGGDALLITAPRYIDEEELAAAAGTVNIPVIHSDGETHRLVFLANIYVDPFLWRLSAGTSTYADLLNCCIYLDGEERSYNRDNRTIPMSATVTAKIDGRDIGGVALTRSLAKISLDLKIDAAKAAGFTVRSIRMRDVQNRLDICDAQKIFSAIYPDKQFFDVIDYGIIANTDGTPLLTDSGESKTFVWYVPRNTRGTVGGLTAKTRNTDAPLQATYFEIVAQDASNNYIIYRIYPGADGEGDFNIVPNRVYSYSLTIEGDGGETPDDSRITHLENDVVFEGSSNSFLINPPYADMPARTFTIPVKRVKEYWVPAYHGYGGLGGDPLTAPAGTPKAGKSLEWEVSLLWQDAADIVRPADAADPEKNIVIGKSTGRGSDDYFQITVPAGVRHGNFVVCIKCTDESKFMDGVLWSWHFWVTDYAPHSEGLPIGKDRFVYPVDGGQVERYVNKYFGYSSDISSSWSSMRWNPEPSATAPYAQSVVMDRCVGALAKGYVKERPRENGVFFQYGRKDPFPANIYLYNISGNRLTNQNSVEFPEQKWVTINPNTIPSPVEIVNIPFTVRNPMLFFIGNKDWSGLNETSYYWCDSQTAVANLYVTKSVYDPCPEGWRMTMSVWTDFRQGTTTNNLNRKLAADNGIYYYPETGNKTKPAETSIFYPSMAARYWSNASMWSTAYGFCWTPKPQAEDRGYYLYYSTSFTGVNLANYRSIGMPVRCVSDNYTGD